VLPFAVAKRIIVKFLTNESVKPEILKRLRAKFDDETLSRTHVYVWNNSFKECRAEVEKCRILRLLQGKFWPEFLFFVGGGGETVKVSYLQIF
jgi:hypothetical protein